MATADPNAPTSVRDAMRSWVIGIARAAKRMSPEFVIVAQNGEELITFADPVSAPLATDYLDAVDGLGREDLFFGYTADDEPTPSDATERMLSYLARARREGVRVLAIDYCSSPAHVQASYDANSAHGFISFAAPRRELDVIPVGDSFPIDPNDAAVTDLMGVRNFFVLINPRRYPDGHTLVEALADVNVDLLIIDGEAEDGPLTLADVDRLRHKPNGARRLVLCYLSIGEAEEYRGYWQAEWAADPPDWLLAENPAWSGNYTVRFWDASWQAIVYRQLERIVAAGFDGVYLDCVDAYERFEDGTIRTSTAST